MFFLALLRPLGHTCQISDDPRRVIQVLRAAFRTLVKAMLADKSAVVTDRVRHVEREIVATRADSVMKQFDVLFFR